MAKQSTVWDKGGEQERKRASLQARILLEHNRVTSPSRLSWETIATPKMLLAREYWLRDIAEWKPQIKSQNVTRMRINLAHHLFKQFSIPRFMDNLWKETLPSGANFQKSNNVSKDNLLVDFFLPWYIALGRGESLYRVVSSTYLSRKETHFFTQAPNELNPQQAVWWTRARGLGANLGQANNIAFSEIGDKPILPTGDFWISVVRFFVQQDVKSSEFQGLIDYIKAMLGNPYSLKGRTRLSMLEASRQWHRVTQNQKEMSRHKWESTGIPTWEYKTGSLEDKTLLTWSMREILTGTELVQEGHAQRHCVASYKNSCVNRSTSIWTLRRQKNFLESERTITVELNKEGDVVQARGFANRLPKPEEKHVLNKWIFDNNLGMKRY